MERISQGAYPSGRGAEFRSRLLALSLGDCPFFRKHSPVSRRIYCKLARATRHGVGWLSGFDRNVPLANHLGLLSRETRVGVVGGGLQQPHGLERNGTADKIG